MGKSEISVKKGNVLVMGAYDTKTGINFSVQVPLGKTAELLIYQTKEGAADITIPLIEEYATGEIRSVFIEGMKSEAIYYNYKIDGIVKVDPYTRAMCGQRSYIPKNEPRPTKPLLYPYEDTILYKLHVKGFTNHKTAKVKHPGTFQGVAEKIPYIKTLDITSVVFMPVYEFDEYSQEKIGTQKTNYWGYGKGQYFVPKASYAASVDAISEFSDLVQELHKNKLECILEFYFDSKTPAFFVKDVLRYWLIQYAVDGFHLLGEGAWIQELLRDPLLKETKLLYTGFDAGELYHTPPVYRNLGEYNLGFQHDMRRFLKGDQGVLPSAVYRQRRTSSTYGVINYMADHDGFTMYDMVSYELKHNEENGENNTDGSNLNYTWNCGTEGETRKLKIKRLRMQQLRNAWMLLLFSEGVPLLYAGDEFCNTQKGNNNAYCQDNETGWLVWNTKKSDQDMQGFVKACITFRNAHPILHRKDELSEHGYRNQGAPELSYHSTKAWLAPFEESERSVGIMLNGSEKDVLYMAINMHWEPHALALPRLDGMSKWQQVADTMNGFYPLGQEPKLPGQKEIEVPPRCIVILEAQVKG